MIKHPRKLAKAFIYGPVIGDPTEPSYSAYLELSRCATAVLLDPDCGIISERLHLPRYVRIVPSTGLISALTFEMFVLSQSCIGVVISMVLRIEVANLSVCDLLSPPARPAACSTIAKNYRTSLF